MTNIAELMREAAENIDDGICDPVIGRALREAAAELERAEQEQKEQDLLLYGVSYSKDGKRIDPSDVVIQYPPTSAVPEGWVPVGESLPEDGELVMVYTPGEDGGIDFDGVEDGRWVSHDDHYEHFIAVGGYSLGGDDCSVTGPGPDAPYTHWMPLPAAPQQGGSDSE